ncbi:unnamed protein product [Ectocarpus sp. CCAP 1310/34]|nr:unnamed protein product [Ectocarpus sp. CCAP 1310/34]
MLPFVAIAVVFGVSMLGPFLMGSQGDCSSNNSSSSEERTVSRCEVEEVARAMRKRKMPVELKVEAEGKLYSIPDGVKMVRPGFEGKKGKWWKRISRKTKDSSDDDGGSNDMPKPPACLEEVMATGAADGNDVAPGRRSGDGDIGGEGPAAGEDLRSAVERACQICFGQNYSTVMLPCGHGGLCWECGLHIYALKEECPMCRTKIELLVPLDNENKRFEGGREFVPSSTAFGKDGKTL